MNGAPSSLQELRQLGIRPPSTSGGDHKREDNLAAYIFAAVLAFSVLQPTPTTRYAIAVAALISILRLRHSRLGRPDVVAVLYATLILTSIVWSVAASRTEVIAFSVGSLVALFVAGRLAINTVRQLRIAAFGLVVGGLIAILLTVLNDPLAGFRLTFASTDPRFALQGLNANYTAYSYVTIAAACFIFRASGRKGGWLAAWGLVAALYLGIALNGTRGAVVALAALVAWHLVGPLLRTVRQIRLVVVMATIAIVPAALGLVDNQIRSFFSASGGRTAEDLSGRLTLWPLARSLFSENWFVGRGAGSFEASPGNPFGVAAHNAILDIGTSTGILGILLFFSIPLLCLLSCKTPTSARVMAGLIIATVPIWATGYWIESPVYWCALALCSRVSLLDVADHATSVDHVPGTSKQKPRTVPSEPTHH